MTLINKVWGCGVNGKAVWNLVPGDCEFDPHHPHKSKVEEKKCIRLKKNHMVS